MSERTLWTWLRPYCPAGQYTRVENGEAGPGTPDVHYRIPEGSGWIELKEARNPTSEVPFPNDKVGLHKSQKKWISEHVTFGGTVFIVARIGEEIFWIPGKYAEAFNEASQRRLRHLSALVHTHEILTPTIRKIKQLLGGES